MSNKSNNANEQISKEYGEKAVELPLHVTGILFGIIIALTPSLLTASNLSTLQRASLILFCIAFPCLGGYALIVYMIRAAKVDPQGSGKLFLSLQMAGLLTAILGIGTDIMSTSLKAGFVYIITSFIALMICGNTIRDINIAHIKNYVQVETLQQKDKQ